MRELVVFALMLGGCACEPIDTSGCAAPFDSPCHTYTRDGVSCVPSAYTCYDSPCQCDNSYVVVCPRDLSVPQDFSRPARDLTTDDDGGSDDGGFDGG